MIGRIIRPRPLSYTERIPVIFLHRLKDFEDDSQPIDPALEQFLQKCEDEREREQNGLLRGLETSRKRRKNRHHRALHQPLPQRQAGILSTARADLPRTPGAPDHQAQFHQHPDGAGAAGAADSTAAPSVIAIPSWREIPDYSSNEEAMARADARKAAEAGPSVPALVGILPDASPCITVQGHLGLDAAAYIIYQDLVRDRRAEAALLQYDMDEVDEKALTSINAPRVSVLKPGGASGASRTPPTTRAATAAAAAAAAAILDEDLFEALMGTLERESFAVLQQRKDLWQAEVKAGKVPKLPPTEKIFPWEAAVAALKPHQPPLPPLPRALYNHWIKRRKEAGGPLLQYLWYEQPWKAICFEDREPGHEGEQGDMPFMATETKNSTRSGWNRIRIDKQEAYSRLMEVRDEFELLRTTADQVRKRERLKKHMLKLYRAEMAAKLGLNLHSKHTACTAAAAQAVAEGTDAAGTSAPGGCKAAGGGSGARRKHGGGARPEVVGGAEATMPSNAVPGRSQHGEPPPSKRRRVAADAPTAGSAEAATVTAAGGGARRASRKSIVVSSSEGPTTMTTTPAAVVKAKETPKQRRGCGGTAVPTTTTTAGAQGRRRQHDRGRKTGSPSSNKCTSPTASSEASDSSTSSDSSEGTSSESDLDIEVQAKRTGRAGRCRKPAAAAAAAAVGLGARGRNSKARGRPRQLTRARPGRRQVAAGDDAATSGEDGVAVSEDSSSSRGAGDDEEEGEEESDGEGSSSSSSLSPDSSAMRSEGDAADESESEASSENNSAGGNGNDNGSDAESVEEAEEVETESSSSSEAAEKEEREEDEGCLDRVQERGRGQNRQRTATARRKSARRGGTGAGAAAKLLYSLSDGGVKKEEVKKKNHLKSGGVHGGGEDMQQGRRSETARRGRNTRGRGIRADQAQTEQDHPQNHTMAISRARTRSRSTCCAHGTVEAVTAAATAAAPIRAASPSPDPLSSPTRSSPPTCSGQDRHHQNTQSRSPQPSRSTSRSPRRRQARRNSAPSGKGIRGPKALGTRRRRLTMSTRKEPSAVRKKVRFSVKSKDMGPSEGGDRGGAAGGVLKAQRLRRELAALLETQPGSGSAPGAVCASVGSSGTSAGRSAVVGTGVVEKPSRLDTAGGRAAAAAAAAAVDVRRAHAETALAGATLTGSARQPRGPQAPLGASVDLSKGRQAEGAVREPHNNGSAGRADPSSRSPLIGSKRSLEQTKVNPGLILESNDTLVAPLSPSRKKTANGWRKELAALLGKPFAVTSRFWLQRKQSQQHAKGREGSNGGEGDGKSGIARRASMLRERNGTGM